MTPAPNPRAWAVATALATESGLDWAAWAAGLTKPRPYWPDPNSEVARWKRDDVAPVPAPWDADAYRADCARRGVEPGPMPSLRFDDGGRLRWSVFVRNSGAVSAQIESGAAWASVVGGELEEFGDGDGLGTGWGRATLDDLAAIYRLATAAKRAMGT